MSRVARMSGASNRECQLRAAHVRGVKLQLTAMMSCTSLEVRRSMDAVDLEPQPTSRRMEITMDNASLTQKLNLHALWVKSAEADGCRLNLEYEDLRGLTLPNATLVGAKLNSADFRGSNLEHADFTGADLGEADFRDTNLERSNFSVANLRGARFAGAHLSNATLERANQQYADFRDTDLTGATLNEARLMGSNFRRADMNNAILRGVDLGCADLREANLTGADFAYADLRGANFDGAIVDSKTNFLHAKMDDDSVTTIHHILAHSR